VAGVIAISASIIIILLSLLLLLALPGAGIVFGIIFYLISAPALRLMGLDESFIHLSIKYMKIIAFGVPASTVYNYAGAIIRSVGDSKTPLIVLAVSGFINVLLNLLFVICFDMDVDGVALATIISQYVSAISVVAVLIRRKHTPYAFSFKKMSIDKSLLLKSMRLGIPTGI
jgi:Na+-driven multidrug efflux pump